MEWIDVTKEIIAEDVPAISGESLVFYSHKFGSILSLVGNKKIIALSGLKSGNYKAEMEYVKGEDEITVRVFMREPAEIFKK